MYASTEDDSKTVVIINLNTCLHLFQQPKQIVWTIIKAKTIDAKINYIFKQES